MRFPVVGLILILLSGWSFAQGGRSPAVEDFVGIEVDQPDSLSQGQSLNSLEKDMQQLEKVEASTYISTPKSQAPREHRMGENNEFFQFTFVNVMAVSLLLFLPLLSWVVAMNHLRKKATAESASNIEVLEKYRRERELARKKEEEYKKAS